jgi:hypothetical protein
VSITGWCPNNPTRNKQFISSALSDDTSIPVGNQIDVEIFARSIPKCWQIRQSLVRSGEILVGIQRRQFFCGKLATAMKLLTCVIGRSSDDGHVTWPSVVRAHVSMEEESWNPLWNRRASIGVKAAAKYGLIRILIRLVTLSIRTPLSYPEASINVSQYHGH